MLKYEQVKWIWLNTTIVYSGIFGIDMLFVYSFRFDINRIFWMNSFEWRHHFGFVNKHVFILFRCTLFGIENKRVFSTCIHHKCQLNIIYTKKTLTQTYDVCLRSKMITCMEQSLVPMCVCTICVHFSCYHLLHSLVHTSSSCCWHIFSMPCLVLHIIIIINAQREFRTGRVLYAHQVMWAQTHTG